jgi:hypothetical protein
MKLAEGVPARVDLTGGGSDDRPQLATTLNATPRTTPRAHSWSPVLTVAGEIDAATVGQFEQALRSATAESHELVVDLSATRFLSCAGIAVLFIPRPHRRGTRGSRHHHGRVRARGAGHRPGSGPGWVYAIRVQPFTAQYARETVPREYWHTREFRSINRRISAAVIAVIAAMAVSHALGGLLGGRPDPGVGPLHRLVDLVFNWIIPGLLVWRPNHPFLWGTPGGAVGWSAGWLSARGCAGAGRGGRGRGVADQVSGRG